MTAPLETRFCRRFAAMCGSYYKWESCATEFPKLALGQWGARGNTQRCRITHMGSLMWSEGSEQDRKVRCPRASKASSDCVDVAKTTTTSTTTTTTTNRGNINLRLIQRRVSVNVLSTGELCELADRMHLCICGASRSKQMHRHLAL